MLETPTQVRFVQRLHALEQRAIAALYVARSVAEGERAAAVATRCQRRWEPILAAIQPFS